MVGRVAEAETELAEAASRAGAAEGVSALAGSLAEAIEADHASAAAAEARQTVVGRTEAVAGAFARVSRAVRLTVLLAERLDRGWARRGLADDRHSMARRQIAHGVAEAIGREAEGERAQRLTDALAERLERLDVEAELGAGTVGQTIAAICRDLGLDAARRLVRPPVRAAGPERRCRPAVGGEIAGRSGGRMADGWRWCGQHPVWVSRRGPAAAAIARWMPRLAAPPGSTRSRPIAGCRVAAGSMGAAGPGRCAPAPPRRRAAPGRIGCG